MLALICHEIINNKLAYIYIYKYGYVEFIN